MVAVWIKAWPLCVFVQSPICVCVLFRQTRIHKAFWIMSLYERTKKTTRFLAEREAYERTISAPKCVCIHFGKAHPNKRPCQMRALHNSAATARDRSIRQCPNRKKCDWRRFCLCEHQHFAASLLTLSPSLAASVYMVWFFFLGHFSCILIFDPIPSSIIRLLGRTVFYAAIKPDVNLQIFQHMHPARDGDTETTSCGVLTLCRWNLLQIPCDAQHTQRARENSFFVNFWLLLLLAFIQATTINKRRRRQRWAAFFSSTHKVCDDS